MAFLAAEYMPEHDRIELLSYEATTGDHGARITAQLLVDGEHRTVIGEGNGPIAAFVHALRSGLGTESKSSTTPSTR